MKPAIILVAGCAVLIASGCESDKSLKASAWEQTKQIKQQKNDLETQVEKLKAKNKQLQEQIVVLSKMPAGVNPDELYGLEKLIISKRTGFYDKDNDGQKEKLILYLRPIDADGDALKATGDVIAELWDLNQKPKEALLGQWHIGPSELKKMWVGGMLTHYYRLSFDVAEEIEKKKELTLRASFTDHLTGKVLTAQTIVNP